MHHNAYYDFPIQLESYVDDVFGGANTKEQAGIIFSEIISVGLLTTAVINKSKCHGPCQIIDVLGLRYNAIKRRVNLPPPKQEKYLQKLQDALSALIITSKDLEKLIGYLCYASWAEPFGRPFLSALTAHVDRKNPNHLVCFDRFATTALKI